jgi:hypothetical protein
MPTHLNLRYQEIETLWPGVERLQALADQYGIYDIFQDAGGKMLQLAIACGLDVVPGRTGPDAQDRIGNQYEVKTVDLTNNPRGFTTSHHVTSATIQRYRSRRWVFAMYDRITLREAYLVEAVNLEPVFQNWEVSLMHVNHLNNPKIPIDFVRKFGTTMYMKDVAPPWVKLPEAA